MKRVLTTIQSTSNNVKLISSLCLNIHGVFLHPWFEINRMLMYHFFIIMFMEYMVFSLMPSKL